MAGEGRPHGEPVEVPWGTAVPDFRCFGCSPHNRTGLRLGFFTHPRGLEARFRPGRDFESYPGLLHGGVTGAVCDETMGNLVALTHGRPVFTATMRMRYVAPLPVDAAYRCVASLREPVGRPYDARCEILDEEGQLMATATGTFQPVDLRRARSRLRLSDQESDRFLHSLTQTGWRPTDDHHHAPH
ncbi:PaaI family thioesterase [Streptomyces sp. TBY4]|uniref:PaaI family thioesterase n=1 Tax=Streptomyces sp. TBY4 TaxID=2962030 RepID=UPI0020B89B65|nr:PaaI family thioesterase [Streptomyces sp. TBY4]MCP3757263.1 PaaI family thioesterase [Streptomyces sp. TBY4]